MPNAPRPPARRPDAPSGGPRRARHRPAVRPHLERLERRVLLSAGNSIANAFALPFSNTSVAYQTAHASHYLVDPNAVELSRISLVAGDVVTAAVDTTPYGGGLNSYLRVFQDLGGGDVRQVASNDDFRGRDAGLTFQASATGAYYVGVSSFDNTAYSPAVAGGGAGSSRGLFDLNLTKTPAAAAPLLAGSSFHLSRTTGAAGDQVTVGYTIENRGGASANLDSVSLLASANDRFADGLSPVQAASPHRVLSAGEVFTGSFSITLGAPGTSLATFGESGAIFLGLKINDAGPSSPAQGNDWASLQSLKAETAGPEGSNRTTLTAQKIALDSRTDGIALSPGDEAFFRVVVDRPGNFTARVDGMARPASLTLYDSKGVPLVQSGGRSVADPAPSIAQSLTGISANTCFYLKVANGGSASALGSLSIRFEQTASDLNSVPLAGGASALVQGDFNGDGRLDLAVAGASSKSVLVLLGDGDGTFRNAGSFDTGLLVGSLTVGDFNGDGRLDLIAMNTDDRGVSLLTGNGDGTFRSGQLLDVRGGTSLVVGDFNGDSRLDFAVVNPQYSTLTVVLGTGTGSFLPEPRVLSLPGGPVALTTGDFNEDGRPDLAVACGAADAVVVFLGAGDGTFVPGQTLTAGKNPFTLVAGDFDGDGHLDLAIGNYASRDVTVILGDGRGTFANARTFPVRSAPKRLVTGDFNGDGRLDLAFATSISSDVTVLLANGDRTFSSSTVYAFGSHVVALTAGDFDGDGRVDLATADLATKNVAILLAQGDGTFPGAAPLNTAGSLPHAIASGDFNGDGRIDLAVANFASGDVTVLLGEGDGTFAPAGSYPVGTHPVALVVGDFNGDGRADLAVADSGSNDITILLGNGDGTFPVAEQVVLAGSPTSLAAGDFDEDGHLDLVVATGFTNPDGSAGSSVVFLRSRGNGTFDAGVSFDTGSTGPDALVAGDFTGDGHLDIATANSNSGDVWLLRGSGLGRFSLAGTTPLPADPQDQPYGVRPFALVAGYFEGDTHLDLAVASQSYYSSDVSVLTNDGSGGFRASEPVALAPQITSLAAGDFDGDGHLDLVAVGPIDTSSFAPDDLVTLLRGNGGGGFAAPVTFTAGVGPVAVAAADFNGDGRLDVAAVNEQSGDVTVLVGTGDGSLVPPVLAPSPVLSTPIVANWTGSAVPDAVVLTETGKIAFRRGLADQPGAFAPPVVLNPDPAFAARDLAIVRTAGGFLLAALDAHPFANANGENVSRVTLYLPHPDGTFTVAGTVELPPGFLPANIASADLTGGGLGGLVITAALDKVFVSLQTTPGVFAAVAPYDVGVNPSSIALRDLDGDSRPDIVVTDRFSGQVSVLLNRGDGTFLPEGRFRAGTGLYGLSPVDGSPAVYSLEGTAGVVAGLFAQETYPDLVVINSGAKSFSLLGSTAGGGFLNPEAARTFPLAAPPTAIVAGHFVTGDPNLDLAVLSAEGDTVTIFRGDGRGGFVEVSTIDAGNRPTGLTVADVSRPGGGGPDGVQDLLIGNAFGDLLIVTGNGDGTFSPYRRADQNVTLAATAATAARRPTFYFSDKGTDRLAYASAAPGAAVVSGATIFQDRGDGIQAPGALAVVTVGDAQYLLVANSGANDLLVYRLDADGRPILASKQTYFTGTDPVGITTTTAANDLNGDGVADVVVANQGSNDVSVFLGRMTNGTWTLAYRPRQSSGGLGPTSVAVASVTGDGTPDLLVSNGQSNTVSVLVGRGNGYFVNQTGGIAPIRTGRDPVQVLVGNFDGTGGLDLVTVNRGSDDITLVANFLTEPVASTVSSGGSLPVFAAVFDDNGISDLLVANVGDGALEWLRGGTAGLEVMAILASPDLPHLSGLALIVTGDQIDAYGADAGREVAALLASFGPSSPPANFVPPSPGFSAGLEIVADGGSEGTPPAGAVSTPQTISADESILQVFPIGFAARFLNAIAFPPGLDGVSDSPEAQPEIGAGNPPLAPPEGAGILLLNLGEPDATDGPPRDIDEGGSTAAPLRAEPDVWQTSGAWQRPAGQFAAVGFAESHFGNAERPEAVRAGDESGGEDLSGDTSRTGYALTRDTRGDEEGRNFFAAAFWISLPLGGLLPHRPTRGDARRGRVPGSRS